MHFQDIVCDTSCAAPYWESYSAAYNDHLYSADFEDIISNMTHGYAFEKRIGFIFREPVASASGFYLLYNSEHTDHVYTLNVTEADELIQRYGYFDLGYVGYIYSSAICGSIPLYRLYNVEEYDHYYTVNESDRDSRLNEGYISQGTAGYILPQP